jgi:hypothetical protein
MQGTVYRASDWESLTIQIDGKTVVDLESVQFGGGSEINVGYGKGRKPRRYSKKQVKAPEGKLKMHLEEFAEFIKKFKEKGLYGDVAFNIVMLRANEDLTDFKVTLKACQLTADDFTGLEEDSDGAMVELDFLCLGGRDINGVADLA